MCKLLAVLNADLRKTLQYLKFTVKYFLVAYLTVLLGSCTTDPEPLRSDLEYHPLKKGLYHVYKVEETEYTVVNGAFERSYQLMTEVVDSLPTPEGYKYVVHRSIRENDSSAWEYKDTWSVIANNLRVVTDEGSVSFIKLAFPVSKGKTWDGNAYNTLGEDEYEMQSIGEIATVNSVEFEDCIVVNQNDFDDPIVSMDIRKEVYARGVGLILSEISLLNYCTDTDCLGQKKIEDGIIRNQTIIGYGVR